MVNRATQELHRTEKRINKFYLTHTENHIMTSNA